MKYEPAHPTIDLFFDIKTVEGARAELRRLSEEVNHLQELLNEHHPLGD